MITAEKPDKVAINKVFLGMVIVQLEKIAAYKKIYCRQLGTVKTEAQRLRNSVG